MTWPDVSNEVLLGDSNLELCLRDDRRVQFVTDVILQVTERVDRRVQFVTDVILQVTEWILAEQVFQRARQTWFASGRHLHFHARRNRQLTFRIAFS